MEEVTAFAVTEEYLMRIRLVFLSLVLFIQMSTGIAGAQSFGGDVHVLHEPNNLTTLSPEYSWKSSHCGGFGYLDVLSEGDLKYISDHSLDCNLPNGPLFLSTEIGVSNFGPTYRLGMGVNIKMPRMAYLNLTLYPAVTHGGGDREQVKVVWGSSDFKIAESLVIYISGFARLRFDLPDVIQPQIWIKKSRSLDGRSSWAQRLRSLEMM